MGGDIPADILKRSVEVHLNLFIEIMNRSFRGGAFPEVLEFTEVSPIVKRNDSLNKENYRPVSVLSPISKVPESMGL